MAPGHKWWKFDFNTLSRKSIRPCCNGPLPSRVTCSDVLFLLSSKDSFGFILTYALLYPAPQPKIKTPVASVPFHEKPPWMPCTVNEERERRCRLIPLTHLEHQSRTLCLLVTTVGLLVCDIASKGSCSKHTQARSACIASVPTGPWSCRKRTPISAQPSLWSWPSCGRQAWSDHHNQTASGRICAFPGRKAKPIVTILVLHIRKAVADHPSRICADLSGVD